MGAEDRVVRARRLARVGDLPEALRSCSALLYVSSWMSILPPSFFFSSGDNVSQAEY